MNDASPTWTPLARKEQSTAATLTSTPAAKPAASSSASCAHDVGGATSAQRLRARAISAFSSSCGTSAAGSEVNAVAVGGGGGGGSATATSFVAVGGGASGCRGGGGGGVMRREERATHDDVELHKEAFRATAALSALQRSHPWHWAALKGETQFSSLQWHQLAQLSLDGSRPGFQESRNACTSIEPKKTSELEQV